MGGCRTWRKGTAWFSALGVLLLGGILTFMAGRTYVQYQEQGHIQAISLPVQQAAQRLEQALRSALALHATLARQVSEQGFVDKERLIHLSEELVANQSFVVSVSSAKGWVVDFIYPLLGNEAVLGMDYRLRPEQLVGIQRAIAAHHTVVSGPIPLVQNGRLGIIGRTPIFCPSAGANTDQYWGLISVAMDLHGLLESVGLLAGDLPFHFALRDIEQHGSEGAPFYGQREWMQQPHKAVAIQFPGGSWQLVAIPLAATQDGVLVLWLIRGVGILLSVALSLGILVRYERIWRTECLSLRTFLMLLLLLILLPIVGASSYLSYRNTAQLNRYYIQQLSNELGQRIYDRLAAFFELPKQVLGFNLEQSHAGLLPYESHELLTQSFLLQLRQHPSLSFIALGMADGTFYGSNRPPLGRDRGLRIIQTLVDQQNILSARRADYINRLGSLVYQGKQPFDARTRPWFKAAMERGSLGWYPVYAYSLNDDEAGSYHTLGMGVSAPIYDPAGQWVGVMAVDFALSQLSSFLAELMVGQPDALVWITEANGDLLASSSLEPIFHTEPMTQQMQRLNALNSQNPLIRLGSEQLQAQHRMNGATSVTVQGQSYRLDWRAYDLVQGPSLTIAIMVPEFHFNPLMGNALYNTLLLAMALVLVCLVLGLFATNGIARPLAALSAWAARLAKGDWAASPSPNTPVREIIVLSAALDTMGSQLKRNTEELELRIYQRTADLEQLNLQLAELSITDGLTGIANRRHLDEMLEYLWAQAKRDHQPMALLMIDVDWFKKYNDHYGHLAGDGCLKAIAGLLRHHTRRMGDLAARYGGEEFVVIAVNTDQEAAHHFAEKLRQAVEALKIPHALSPFGVVSVSIGVAVGYPDAKWSTEELLSVADEAMYRAKSHGRNQVN